MSDEETSDRSSDVARPPESIRKLRAEILSDGGSLPLKIPHCYARE